MFKKILRSDMDVAFTPSGWAMPMGIIFAVIVLDILNAYSSGRGFWLLDSVFRSFGGTDSGEAYFNIWSIIHYLVKYIPLLMIQSEFLRQETGNVSYVMLSRVGKASAWVASKMLTLFATTAVYYFIIMAAEVIPLGLMDGFVAPPELLAEYGVDSYVLSSIASPFYPFIIYAGITLSATTFSLLCFALAVHCRGCSNAMTFVAVFIAASVIVTVPLPQSAKAFIPGVFGCANRWDYFIVPGGSASREVVPMGLAAMANAAWVAAAYSLTYRRVRKGVIMKETE